MYRIFARPRMTGLQILPKAAGEIPSVRPRAGCRQTLAGTMILLMALLVATSAAPQQTDSPGGQQTDSPDGQQTDFSVGLNVIGLTGNGRLVQFRTVSPETAKLIGKVFGLVFPDTFLIGIDFRVQDGKLYGVGNRGGIYMLDTTNARATPAGKLTVPLSGTSFGVDFNPAANALRIISDTGQNLRQPFAGFPVLGPTQTDAPLTYTQPPVDPTLPRPAPVAALGVTAAAYTNNDIEPDPANPQTATTLFVIDTKLDQVDIQSPPNNGILVATGKLGADADPISGFDIYSRLRKNGLTADNFGFAVLLANGNRGFYRINLLTGRARLIGNFNKDMVDIALPLNQ